MAAGRAAVVCTVPPYFELRNRGRPTRVYLLHMGLFVGLMVAGWAGVAAAGDFPPADLGHGAADGGGPGQVWHRAGPLLGDRLVRAYFVRHRPAVRGSAYRRVCRRPAGLADRSGLGASEHWSGLLVTAVYAAGMAVIQRDCRRLFANLFLSHASLVLVGLELHTELSLTGSLCLWFSVILSLGGFGLTIRAIGVSLWTARASPSIRASIRIPPGWRFASCLPAWHAWASLVRWVSSQPNCWWIARSRSVPMWASRWWPPPRSTASPWSGPTCSSSQAVGTPRRSSSASAIGNGFAVLTFSALILGGGFFPQPGVASRHRAAAAILGERANRPGAVNVASGATALQPTKLLPALSSSTRAKLH